LKREGRVGDAHRARKCAGLHVIETFQVLAACAALVSLAAFVLLFGFRDEAVSSAYGPHAGALAPTRAGQYFSSTVAGPQATPLGTGCPIFSPPNCEVADGYDRDRHLDIRSAHQTGFTLRNAETCVSR
jgi:hypothetical protein